MPVWAAPRNDLSGSDPAQIVRLGHVRRAMAAGPCLAAAAAGRTITETGWQLFTSMATSFRRTRYCRPEKAGNAFRQDDLREIFDNDEAFGLFCSIAASGEAKGRWENGRIAAGGIRRVARAANRSLSRHQQHQQHHIETGLLRADPQLAAMLGLFGRLVARVRYITGTR